MGSGQVDRSVRVRGEGGLSQVEANDIPQSGISNPQSGNVNPRSGIGNSLSGTDNHRSGNDNAQDDLCSRLVDNIIQCQ